MDKNKNNYERKGVIMKKCSKKLLSLLLAGVMAFSAAACGDSSGNSGDNNGNGGNTGGEGSTEGESSAGENSSSGSENGTGGRTQITFWHIIPEGSDGYDSLDALITNFNNVQDEYEIVHVGYPFLDYFSKMTTAFAGDVAPDVFMYTLDDVPIRAEAGTIANLSPYMEADNYDTSDLYEAEVAAGVYNGDQYALPLSSTCRLLWYNLDLFEAAGLTEEDVPTTWEELYEVAHKMDIVEDGVIQQLGFDPTAGQSNYFSLLWQAGLDFFDEEGNPQLDQEGQREVLQWMIDFNKEYPSSQLQAFTDAGAALAADGFASGRLAMMVGNDQEYAILKNSQVEFKYGVAPMPIPAEGGVRCNWSSCWSLEAFQSNDEAKIAGSWEFIKYMLEPENMKAFFESQGWLTASKTANEELRTDDIMNTIVDEVAYSREKTYFDFAPKWHEDWNQFMELAKTGTPVEDVLAQAQKFYLEKRDNYESTH